jgi:putative ABC transport system permease protein
LAQNSSRKLLKNWLSTLINILGLSFGLAIFYWFSSIGWMRNPMKNGLNKENIYLLEYKNSAFGYMTSSSYPMLEVSKQRFRKLRISPSVTFGMAINSAQLWKCFLLCRCGKCNKFVLEFFPYEKIAGNYKNALQNDNQIALSEETAKLLLAKIIKIALANPRAG